MTFYEQIIKLEGHFHSLRLHEGLLVIDLKLPNSWKVKEVIASRDNKIQLQVGPKDDKYQIISFFSAFDEPSTITLQEEILEVIRWNKEIEEKDALLNQKMLELRKVFNENNIYSLRNLDINFKTTLLDLNGQTELEPVVREGDTKGPEGTTNS